MEINTYSSLHIRAALLLHILSAISLIFFTFHPLPVNYRRRGSNPAINQQSSRVLLFSLSPQPKLVSFSARLPASWNNLCVCVCTGPELVIWGLRFCSVVPKVISRPISILQKSYVHLCLLKYLTYYDQPVKLT